jgi:hypothetical protein
LLCLKPESNQNKINYNLFIFLMWRVWFHLFRDFKPTLQYTLKQPHTHISYSVRPVTFLRVQKRRSKIQVHVRRTLVPSNSDPHRTRTMLLQTEAWRLQSESSNWPPELESSGNFPAWVITPFASKIAPTLLLVENPG